MNNYESILRIDDKFLISTNYTIITYYTKDIHSSEYVHRKLNKFNFRIQCT